MFDANFYSFLGLAAVLTLTPGADTMLTIRNALARGTSGGLWTTAGICAGFFVQPTLAALGLAAIFLSSELAFNLVKWAGAAYLLYLGTQSLISARRWWHESSDGDVHAATPGSDPVSGWQSFREGLLTNALNPKIAVFYFAVLPQFISPGDSVLAKSLLLSGAHYLMGILWLSTLAIAAGRARHLFFRRRVRAGFEAFAGFAMIGFAVRLAFARSR